VALCHAKFLKGIAVKLNHINLVVPNVQENKAFFERYFGFKCIVEKGPDTFVGLRDEAGTTIALNNFEKVDSVEYPSMFHIGVFQDSRESVDKIYGRLKADGFDAQAPHEEHGSYTFYLKSPGGFKVEVAHDEQAYD